MNITIYLLPMSNWDINNTVKTNSDLLDYLRTYKISPYEAFALIHKQKFKHGKTRDWQLCKYRMYINHRIIDFVNFDRRSKKLTKFDKKTGKVDGKPGVFFYPVWQSDSIVKRQNLNGKYAISYLSECYLPEVTFS